MSKLFEFECLECGKLHFTSPSPEVDNCPLGHTYVRRRYSFAVKRGFQEHFNQAVGRPISNQREFNDALKEASDRQSERTGMEHRYAPIDMRDRDALKVTDE